MLRATVLVITHKLLLVDEYLTSYNQTASVLQVSD